MAHHFSHYVKTSFRCLDEDHIGYIQHLLIDMKEPAKKVAKRFRVSPTTIYRIRKAVPKDLVHINQMMLNRIRRRQKKPKRRNKAG